MFPLFKKEGNLSLLSIYFTCLFSLILSLNAVETPSSSLLIEKNILVNVFPGGKSHNFVLKELFDFSLENKDENEYKINYYIIVHNWDKDAWPENGPYTVFGYGDMALYDMIFNDALDLVRKDPIFGYSKFNKAMVHIYEQFFESGIFEKIRKINFDTMITDIPNFITLFLHNELKIKNNIYCSPPSLPNLYYPLFEMNPSYLPTIGSTATDMMTFSERFVNSLYVAGMKMTFWLFQTEQADTFKRYGYDLKTQDAYVHDSFVMIQYPPGLFYNLSLPPNFIRLNAITPKPADPVDPQIDKFLSRFKRNVYFSQGTIVKIVDFDKVLNIFNHFKDLGFILSFKKEFVNAETVKKFPQNVLLVSWVKQNDLLGDNRIHAFISHGGTNSVSESIYHSKPMIVLGVTLDQINTASVVKTRNVGIVIHDSNDIHSDTLIGALEEVLKPEESNVYLQNCKKYGRLLKSNKNPREEYTYWLRYGFKHGYEPLLIKAYTEYKYWELYNYDVLLVWILIFYLLFIFVKKIFVCIFCSCKAKRKEKLD